MTPTFPNRRLFVAAGLAYFVIILCGLGAELVLRGPLVTPGDATATAAAIQANLGPFRGAIAADLVMALADTAVALLLFAAFRAVAPLLALAAMVLRLMQGVLIASGLMFLQGAALLLTTHQGPDAASQALWLIDMHAHGYDLGLVFFGVNSLLMSVLLWRAGFVPRVLSVGLFAAGGVYLVGSSLRFFGPELAPYFAPAYGLTVLSEAAFALWLLSGGRWTRRVA